MRQMYPNLDMVMLIGGHAEGQTRFHKCQRWFLAWLCRRNLMSRRVCEPSGQPRTFNNQHNRAAKVPPTVNTVGLAINDHPVNIRSWSRIGKFVGYGVQPDRPTVLIRENHGQVQIDVVRTAARLRHRRALGHGEHGVTGPGVTARMVPMIRSARWVLLVSVVATLAGCGPPWADSSGPPRRPTPVTIHIHLDRTRVTAGKSIKGDAVLINSTSKAITVQQCAIDGWLQVGISSPKSPFRAAMGLVACPPSVRLRPGTNRFPITILTTAQECQQHNGQSKPDGPPCPPPLPAGTYRTKVVTVGLPRSTPTPESIQVTLTRA